jgi:hypothetical protein
MTGRGPGWHGDSAGHRAAALSGTHARIGGTKMRVGRKKAKQISIERLLSKAGSPRHAAAIGRLRGSLASTTKKTSHPTRSRIGTPWKMSGSR